MAQSPNKRDNFLDSTKRKLAERAHYICSNPDCRKMTVRAHDDDDKSTITGVAAHIRGASDGLKAIRYDPNQTPEQRKNIKNGVWLCHDCSDIVDKDEHAYPPTVLENWKLTHESFIKTLQFKGYAATLELLRPTLLDVELSKKLIDFFEDRRIIYDLYENEVPNHGLRSVLDIRSELMQMKKQLGQTSPLLQRVVQMQAACRKFMTDLSSVDLINLRWNINNPDWIKFVTTLAELRKILGIHIAKLSSDYQITLSQELQSIIPIQS